MKFHYTVRLANGKDGTDQAFDDSAVAGELGFLAPGTAHRHLADALRQSGARSVAASVVFNDGITATLTKVFEPQKVYELRSIVFGADPWREVTASGYATVKELCRRTAESFFSASCPESFSSKLYAGRVREVPE